MWFEQSIYVQFLNVIVDKQEGTEAEEAGAKQLEAKVEAYLQRHWLRKSIFCGVREIKHLFSEAEKNF